MVSTCHPPNKCKNKVRTSSAQVQSTHCVSEMLELLARETILHSPTAKYGISTFACMSPHCRHLAYLRLERKLYTALIDVSVHRFGERIQFLCALFTQTPLLNKLCPLQKNVSPWRSLEQHHTIEKLRTSAKVSPGEYFVMNG